MFRLILKIMLAIVLLSIPISGWIALYIWHRLDEECPTHWFHD